MIRNGIRFSLAIDEWTSINGNRFMNVFLTSSEKIINLGMVRINGSANSDKLPKILVLKLQEFDININNHIVALTSDGASVMISSKITYPV